MSTTTETKTWQVTELFFKAEEGGEDTQLAKDAEWTTTDETDFTYLPHIQNAERGEDAYDRDGELVTIYRYVNED